MRDTQYLPSSNKLSDELFLLLTPLDSLDIGLTPAIVVGEVGRVGDGVRRCGECIPGTFLLPV